MISIHSKVFKTDCVLNIYKRYLQTRLNCQNLKINIFFSLQIICLFVNLFCLFVCLFQMLSQWYQIVINMLYLHSLNIQIQSGIYYNVIPIVFIFRKRNIHHAQLKPLAIQIISNEINIFKLNRKQQYRQTKIAVFFVFYSIFFFFCKMN